MNQLLEHHIVPAISALLQTSSATVSSKGLESEEEVDQEVTCRKMVIAMKSITLKVAESIADKVIHTAVKNNYAPITVVVLDSWGHTVVSKRMDGCAPVGIPQFAHAKANTCIIMRTESSRQFRDSYVAENDQAKISQLSSMVTLASNNGGMAPFPGGILLDKNIKHIITGEKVRNIFGAIGVSGAKGAEDEICAIAGLEYFKSVENCLSESD